MLFRTRSRVPLVTAYFLSFLAIIEPRTENQGRAFLGNAHCDLGNVKASAFFSHTMHALTLLGQLLQHLKWSKQTDAVGMMAVHYPLYAPNLPCLDSPNHGLSIFGRYAVKFRAWFGESRLVLEQISFKPEG